MECLSALLNFLSMKKKFSEKQITTFLFWIYIFILIWTVLFKGQLSLSQISRYHNINLVPFAGSIFVNGKLDLLEIFANVFVFLPFGLFLPALKKHSFWKQFFIILASSVVIEIMQYVLWVGITDITDVIGNTVGGILGIGIYKLIASHQKENTRKTINLFGILFISIVFILIILLQAKILTTRYFW